MSQTAVPPPEDGADADVAALFKEGFRHHAAGVALVCAATPDGPVGATLSSVASVSAAPPLLSFSMARTSATGAAVLAADAVTVYLLRADQAALAHSFAVRGADRFSAEQGWRHREGSDLPVLTDAAARFTGRLSVVVPAGASWLALMEVDEIELGTGGAPLVHHDRAYWAPGPLDA
ncbi:flavin reductase family protein [Nocardioides sp. CFH 31398]|uniref:flavin reductase family protein n=1 Tax=Nocardioides sp. CFH 31398 TaxID=2919579 RepID=UPI001F064E69|nr:flavin reductase family protein [Nocardioides sp. CFH 31398]MCH1865491.1 flavin reductase family protein [Nocardioides sp. CFH 31398]